MGTLYIDRKEIELRHERGCLVLFEGGQRSGSVPYTHIDRIVIYNRASLDTLLLGVLAEQGISLITLNARNPARCAQTLAKSHNQAARRLSQYKLSCDEAWRRRCSRILVTRKLQAQLAMLLQAMEHRPAQRYILFSAVEQIKQRISALNVDLTRESIRGIEGAGAAAYFKAYCALFAPELNFTGRNRRPPKDPVNACLSLAYTLAHSDAVVACHACGLDPMLGFYHDLSFARESLACDLVELLRPHIDLWVWTQFRERNLRSDQFTLDKSACLMGKAGRQVFYREWETLAVLLRRRLRLYSRILLRAITSDIDDD